MIFEVDPGINTLNEFRHVRKYFAGDGEPGGKRRCHGADGEDKIVKVPAGTIVREAQTGQVLSLIHILQIFKGINRRLFIMSGNASRGQQVRYCENSMKNIII